MDKTYELTPAGLGRLVADIADRMAGTVPQFVLGEIRQQGDAIAKEAAHVQAADHA